MSNMGLREDADRIIDGSIRRVLPDEAVGIDIYKTLQDNDAYPVLQACNGLIFTGPTGTNVNDVAVVLIRRRQDGAKER